LEKLLPRHLELIYLINHFWLTRVAKKYPGDAHKMNVLSLVEESNPKKIRMANLCIVGSHKVNGVAYLHSELLKQDLFKDFHEVFPDKFINKTNGVTTRRWVLCANPRLADLYNEYLKTDEWVLDMDKLRELEKYVDDQDFRNKWRAIKKENKAKLADWVRRECKVELDPESMFDIQVKRIHEYKRQLMNILYVIYRYISIKSMTPEERLNVVPRSVLFSGKAAPAYETAKNIIKLMNEVSYVVNNDATTNKLLKVVFLPNYNVSNAEVIIPASDISQHISTAGTEASGTSNMKFVMNGGLIIGTMDGANVEIYEEVGNENIFIFGARVEKINDLKKIMSTTSPEKYIPPQLQKVFQVIREGMFGERETLMKVISTISNNNDWYLISADFEEYIKMQEHVKNMII
jgi:starch phosphorylase